MILLTEEDGTFLNVESFRKSISITEDSTKHDSKITEILASAQEQVLTELKPFVIPDDIEPDSDIANQISKTIAMYGRAEWFEYISQFEKAKYNTERYETKLESLKKSLKADKNKRTKTTLISKPIKKYPISPRSIKGIALNY